MSDRPVALDFIAAQLHRVLSQLRILRDDVDVVAAAMCRLDKSYDRTDGNFGMLRSEMREILDELRAMHPQRRRTASRLRTLAEASDGAG